MSNPCSVNNGNCTHLCLLSSTYPEGYGCNCPDGLFLADDRRTCCSPAVPGSPMVIAPNTNLMSSATISWIEQPLVCATNYSVSWTYSGPCTGVQGLDGTEVLNRMRQNYTIMNLEPNSEYSVQVVTINNVGSSPVGRVTVHTAFAGKDI